MDLPSSIITAFAWLLDDGFSVVRRSENNVSFERPPFVVDVERDAKYGEVGVSIRRGDLEVGLTSLLIYRGDLSSWVGKTGAAGDFHWGAMVNSDDEAKAAFSELSRELRTFRETALNPDSLFLANAAKEARDLAEAWYNEPRWIKGARGARIAEAVGDWADVVGTLEKYESDLDDETRRLLAKARNELKKPRVVDSG